MAIEISGKKFQTKLLSLMIRNKEFLKKYRYALKAEWFETEEQRTIAGIVFAYFDEYGESPDLDTLEFLVCGIADDSANSTEDWKRLIRVIGTQADDGLSYVFDHAAEFIQYRAYKEAIMLGARLLEEGQYEKIPSAIRDAQKWGRESVPHVDFFSDIESWLRENEIRETIPTGILELDQILCGGPARGELSVVLAAPNTGKTIALINMASGALFSGKRVYHFHAEQTSGVIRARYTARLSNTPFKNIKDDPAKMSKKLYAIQEKTGCDLKISKCAGATIGALRAFIYKHDQPDVIVIDYADKLVSKSKYNDRRHEIAAIYDEMIQIADEFNCSILTASQTNRQAVGKEKVTIKDLAESFEKAAIADNIFALCQSEEERALNVMRIFLAKVRNEDDGINEIECKIMKSLMRIMSASEYTGDLIGA